MNWSLLYLGTHSAQGNSTDERNADVVRVSDGLEAKSLCPKSPDVPHLVISQLLATNTTRRPLTVEPRPAFTETDIANCLDRDAELLRQWQQLLTSRPTAPDLQHLRFRQLVTTLPLASVTLSVAYPVGSHVLGTGSPAEIRQAGVRLPCRTMSRFLARRAWPRVRSQDEDVNRIVRVKSGPGQTDERVSARSPVDVGLQHLPPVPPRPCFGDHYTVQAAHAPQIGYFVQTLKADNRQPALGSIVHSRTSFAVRPGRCAGTARPGCYVSRVAALCLASRIAMSALTSTALAVKATHRHLNG